MRKLKGLVLGLALLFGATLVYQAAAVAAETTTVPNQKVESKAEKKHMKKKPGVKKRKSKKVKAAEASPAPVAAVSPAADNTTKS